MHGIEIRHLRYFLRVADELHFGHAAEILGISQAPLSQQIRQLEDRLGVRLFDRTTRSVQLTPAGRVFASEAEELVASLSNAIDETRMAGGLGSGLLRIGAMAPAVHSILPNALAAFSQKFPSARLDMSLHTTEEQLELLASRNIDVALMRPPRVASGLETREIFREGFVAVLHKDSDLAQIKELTVKDMKGQDFIGFTEIRGIGYQEIVNQHCREAGFLPRVVQRVSHTIGVVTLAAAGLGVGIVPAWVLNEPVNGVCYRRLAELPHSVTLVCAWRSDTMNPLVAPFAKELVSVASRSKKGRTK